MSVLTQEDIAYDDMTKVGRIVIERDEKGNIVVEVGDFDFKRPGSCREVVTRAMAWGRDVLAAEVETHRLAPGGNIHATDTSGADELPDDEAAAAARQRLEVKLQALGEPNSLTKKQWDHWLDALPHDEFIELIKLTKVDRGHVKD